MYYNCDNFPGAKDGTRGRRISVEICHVRSTLMPDGSSDNARCVGCKKWMGAIPDGAVIPCPHCGKILVVVSIKKCPACKGILEEKNEDRDQSNM